MSDLQREKFEKHCALWRYDMGVDENDFFVNATTQRAWNIWVASWQDAIESVVVEFTEQPYFCPSKTEVERASDKGYSDALEMAKKAIEAAGVKYK